MLELDELLDDDPPPLPPPPDELLLLDDELELLLFELELLLDEPELDDEPDEELEDDEPLEELLLDEPELDDEPVDDELVELLELLDDAAPPPGVPVLEPPAPGVGCTIGVDTLVGSVMPVQATANAAGALTSSSRNVRRSVSCCVSSFIAVLLP